MHSLHIHACVLGYVQLFGTPWAIVCQVPLPMGFSRQEYWGGLPVPTPEDLNWPRDLSKLQLLWVLRWQVDSWPLYHWETHLYIRFFFLLVHGPGHAWNTKIPMLILPSSSEEHYQQFLSALSATQFTNLYFYTHTHTMYIMCMCIYIQLTFEQ